MGVLFESIVGTLLVLSEQSPKKVAEEAKPNKDQESHPGGSVEPRVAPFWQGLMVERMTSGGFDEGWGVFSYGGWSDAGQVMVLKKTNPPDQSLLVVGKQNSQEIYFERKLDPIQLQTIISKLDVIKKLDDVDLPMFDGLVFELVYAQFKQIKNKPKNLVFKRVYYKNPGTKQHFPEHDQILDLAQKLKEKSP